MNKAELLACWRHQPTQRKVWALAAPMILSNISVPLVGLVDTAVIGRMDAAYHLGGAAVGATLITFILWGAGFLRMGTTGFAAQAYGRSDGDALRLVLLQSLWMACLIALGVWLLQDVLFSAGVYFLDSSPQLLEQARLYVGIRLVSLPAALANFVLVGWFIGAGKGRAPLLLLLTVNITNVVLDICLVVGLEWGVAGAAWATVIGDYCGLLLGLVLLTPVFDELPGRMRWRAAMQLRGAAPMLRTSRDILIRTLALQAVFYLLMLQGARLGDEVVAANAVLLNFLLLTSHGLDGLAHAVEALGGQALGKRDRPALKRVLVVSLGWSLLVGFGFVLAFSLFGDLIIAMLTTIDSVRDTASAYLPWMAWMPLVAVWSYVLDGLFIGATRAKAMRNAMLMATVLIYLPAAWLLRDAGNHGIWLGFHLFMFARGVILGLWFWHLWRQGRWMPRPVSG
ncbi:MATE family efflux transporter [Pseudomonas profundi]|uniref:MATE family efflux transporter n=1 Tax=Pseudomonas profundi TaxID=1981513 RepID=UPI001CC247D9|nr:MATE family efflux transporter [Pseudomonas profundi]